MRLVGFESAAGRALVTSTFSFSTGAVAPVLMGSTPADGATDVSARTSVIELRFSKPMNNAAGALRDPSGGVTFGTPQWLDGTTARASMSGLRDDAAYAIALEGFVDRAGVALVTERVVFSTGPDRDAPRVVDSDPDQGQIDVDPGRVEELVVRFDEAMDEAAGVGTLRGPDGDLALTVSWSEGGTLARFALPSSLRYGVAFALVLDGFRDLAGNALDESVFLVDGAIAFETGRDLRPPFVGFSDPVEGSTDVRFDRATLMIVFSEAMDTSRRTVELDDGVDPVTVSGTWSMAGTRLTLDVADRLFSGRTIRIDFSAFEDLGGTSLEVDHPYLVDGVLDFEMSAPGGERCNDVLDASAGVPLTEGVGTRWSLAAGLGAVHDGSATCATTGTSSDVVVVYRKTSPARADGGSMLRVTTDGESRGVNLDIYGGACRPSDLAATQLSCLWNNTGWEANLDVGPGDYYIWVSSAGSGALHGAVELTVEEVALPREGSSCLVPWTTASANYEPPPAPREYGSWTLVERAFESYDRGSAAGDSGTMVCDPDGLTGADGVFEIVKTRSDSTLEVRIDLIGTTANTTQINVELLDGCDPRAPGVTSLQCDHSIRAPDGPYQLTSEAAAGTYYLWISTAVTSGAIRGATVSVREVVTEPGETCAAALPIVANATTPISPSSDERFDTPACLPDAGGVTWYRFTATDRLSYVSLTAADPVAAGVLPVDGGGACSPDARSPVAVFAPVGSDVCVAVPSSGGVSAITLTSAPYEGVLGRPTQLPIDRATSSTGSTVAWTANRWIALTPSTLYLGLASSLLRAPRLGPVQAEQLGSDVGIGSGEMGYDGISRGEVIFSLDDASAAGSTRVYRLVTSAGMVSVTPWDAGNAYPATSGMRAIADDGAELIVATNATTASVPTRFFALDPAAPGPGRPLGTNERVRSVTGLAADATDLYLAGTVDGVRGIYRLPRSSLGDELAEPTLLHAASYSTTQAKLFLHTTATRRYLYARATGEVHVMELGADERYLGVLSQLGANLDVTMGFDPAAPALVVFDRASVSTGVLVRLD